MKKETISFKETGYFSKKFLDFIDNESLSYYPNEKNILNVIKNFNFSKVNRELLSKELEFQYKNLVTSSIVNDNIKSIMSDNTFTVTTGHQLNIFTGPMYVIYKIVSVIKLSRMLSEKYTKYKFVPIYWMASEDHDFDEIKSFYSSGKTYSWDIESKGPVGNLNTEALKNICYVKKIPLDRVLHPLMGVDKETGEDRQAKLYDLTSQTSLPTMFHNKERPRNVWIEQLALAERIGTKDSPKLIPDNFEHRVEMFGICAVVLGEDGLVWNMRIMMDSPLAQKYGYSEEASAAAPDKIAEVINLIDKRLKAQEDRKSRYLIGNSMTALDVYWATMSMTILPVPLEIMPKTQQNQGMLGFFEMNSKIPEIASALTDRIATHQQYILTTYCETPAVLGGDPIE